jgi:hypothetical protein
VTPYTSSPQLNPSNCPKSTRGNTECPPSSVASRGSLSKTFKKLLKSKWPCTRSFAIQRKILNSPKYTKLQLVTHFSVCLRHHPFSELSPKNPNHPKSSPPHPKTPILAHSHRPIIKGPHADLILFVTRLL